jgi:uncharacterized membrane protein YfcA
MYGDGKMLPPLLAAGGPPIPILRNLEAVSVLVSSGRMANAGARRRWPKWIGLTLLALVSVIGALYAFLFVRIVPPRSVRVVDAITGKPLPA